MLVILAQFVVIGTTDNHKRIRNIVVGLSSLMNLVIYSNKIGLTAELR